MKLRYLWFCGLFVAAFSFAGDLPLSPRAKALYLDAASYESYLGNHLEAITRLETELPRAPAVADPNAEEQPAPIATGEFELSYRMALPDGRAHKAVFEGGVEPATRNEMAYRLARIYMQQNDPQNALRAIETINGSVPDNIRDDERFLRAEIYIANKKFADAAKLLQGLQGSKNYEGLAGYNLGIALLQGGQEKKGLEQLDKTGQLKSDDEVNLAIRDKANLVLAYRMIDGNKSAPAKQYLERVRLTGPYSNKALLGYGWAEVSSGNFDRAVVPWSVLAKRNITDEAVQESLLDLPYAYGKLDLHGKAALLYGSALEGYDQEIARLDKSIKSVRDGKFLPALMHDELKQDSNWPVKLRTLPDTPETYYLLDLLASNKFQDSLQNYLDLDSLRQRLDRWDADLDAYDELVEIRRKHYEQVLAATNKDMQAIEAQMKAHQDLRQDFETWLKNGLTTPADAAAKAEARDPKVQMRELEERYAKESKGVDEYIRRRLYWKIYGSGDKGPAEVYRRQLDAEDEALGKIYSSLIKIRKEAAQSYQGYGEQIRKLRAQVREAREKVRNVTTQQGRALEVMAINQLEVRRKQLDGYQAQAGLALTESYVQASRKQNSVSGAK
ncbi:MAG: hypothetical protein V4443_06220 [Pseudomonadota bacterium]